MVVELHHTLLRARVTGIAPGPPDEDTQNEVDQCALDGHPHDHVDDASPGHVPVDRRKYDRQYPRPGGQSSAHPS